MFVDFLPDEEFREDVTTAEDELTDDDRESLEEAAALLRALGLAEGDVDLFESQNTLSGEGVAAYYDPERERIIVRGTELTPDIRVTLAHELTHALQDQFVDLDEVEEGLEENQSSLLRAVVEGDASNVGDAYAEEELTPDERTEYDRRSSDEAAGADLADVPAALVAYFQAPYVFGPAFDRIVAERDGPAALNDVLREPPRTDLQLLDPIAIGVVAGELVGEAVAAGEGAGEDDAGLIAQRFGQHPAIGQIFAGAGALEGLHQRDARLAQRVQTGGHGQLRGHVEGLDQLGRHAVLLG